MKKKDFWAIISKKASIYLFTYQKLRFKRYEKERTRFREIVHIQGYVQINFSVSKLDTRKWYLLKVVVSRYCSSLSVDTVSHTNSIVQSFPGSRIYSPWFLIITHDTSFGPIGWRFLPSCLVLQNDSLLVKICQSS